MIEIERKFLVISEDFKKEASKTYHIKQGFLNTDPIRTVRIRITDEKAFITVKGLSSNDGLTRFEWEHEIDSTEAKELLLLCEDNIIDKKRYCVELNHHTFEIDVFEGANKGLIMAEVELKTTEEKFEKPKWLGEEVTGNIKYYNSYLAKTPYSRWK